MSVTKESLIEARDAACSALWDKGFVQTQACVMWYECGRVVEHYEPAVSKLFARLVAARDRLQAALTDDIETAIETAAAATGGGLSVATAFQETTTHHHATLIEVSRLASLPMFVGYGVPRPLWVDELLFPDSEHRADPEDLQAWHEQLVCKVKAHPGTDHERRAAGIRRECAVAMAAIASGGADDSSPRVQLNKRHEEVLEILLDREAFDSDHRVTAFQIAGFAETGENNFKGPVADLVSMGLVCTKKGRGGGCWLTPEGQKLARRKR